MLVVSLQSAWRYSQSSHCEHESHAYLAPLLHVQLIQTRHWHDKNYDILQDRVRAVHESYGADVEARAFDIPVPERVDRSAGKDGQELDDGSG